VLAAGLGSRFGGLKQIAPVGPDGETLMEYSVFDAARAGFARVVFVITSAIEQDFRRRLPARLGSVIDVTCARQDESVVAGQSSADAGRLWGTAHAVLSAEPCIDAPFAVINADDFYGRAAFQAAATALHRRAVPASGSYFVVGYPLGKTLSANGPVSRAVCRIEEGRLAGLVEYTRLRARAAEVWNDGEPPETFSPATPVSMNFWGFAPDVFARLRPMLSDFVRDYAGVPGKELYLPEAVGRLIASGDADVAVLPAGSDWFGMTYDADLAHVRQRIGALVDAGLYPRSLWV